MGQTFIWSFSYNILVIIMEEIVRYMMSDFVPVLPCGGGEGGGSGGGTPG
jgi:hypothetical protein